MPSWEALHNSEACPGCAIFVCAFLVNDIKLPKKILKEKTTLNEIVKLSLVEESLTKQKSRIKWLKENNSNTFYFFKCIYGRRNLNRISMVKKEDGSWAIDLPNTKETFVAYFKNLFEEKNTAFCFTSLEDCTRR